MTRVPKPTGPVRLPSSRAFSSATVVKIIQLHSILIVVYSVAFHTSLHTTAGYSAACNSRCSRIGAGVVEYIKRRRMRRVNLISGKQINVCKQAGVYK